MMNQVSDVRKIRQRGFSMLMILGALAGLAIALTAAYMAGAKNEAETWAGQVGELEARIAQADAALAKQSEAVRQAKADGERRLAAVEAARRKAEAGTAALAADLQRLMAQQPAFPNDPCASACQLLRQPL
jgi:hypothetical protein